MQSPLAAQLQRLARERWARQGLQTLLRSLLAGMALICLGLGASLLLNRPIPLQWLLAAALGIVAIGAISLLRPPLRPTEAARRLDRRFRLNEQLATALELNEAPPQSVAAYLHSQSRQTVRTLDALINERRSFPWQELIAIIALAAVCAGLFVLGDIGAPNLPASTSLPPLAGPLSGPEFPEEPFAQPPGSQPAPQPIPGPGEQALINALADALRDQSITRPAAEALDQGDLAGAASELRDLADNAAAIAPDARSDLAEALRDAAQQLQGSDPTAAAELNEQAQNLQAGDQAAAEALEALADAIEEAANSGDQAAQAGEQGQQGEQGEGDQPGSNGVGNGLGGEQRQQPNDRLDVDGVPLDLDSGNGQTPTENNGGLPTSNGALTPRREGSPDEQLVTSSDDPLRIPAELRDVVQDYFTP